MIILHERFAPRLVPAFVLIAAVALGAPVAASAMSIEQIANLTGPERQKILEDGARKEKEVAMIGGLNEKTAARPLIAAFQKKYPFIVGKTIRADTGEALQRILAEHRAKTYSFDIVFASIVEDLREANLVQPLLTPAIDAYPASERDPERLWFTYNYNYHGIAGANTDRVSAAQLPKTWEDLLDPKWTGKMTWGDSESTGGPFLITYLRALWGEDKALAYFEKLAKQNIVTRRASVRNVLDMVIAGENDLILNPALHHIGNVIKAGAPASATMIDPVLARPGYYLLLKSAPHPHAAMLFADFLLGKEAQVIFREAQYYPAHPEVDAAAEMQPFQPQRRGMKLFVITDKMMTTLTPKSQEIFKNLFQQ